MYLLSIFVLLMAVLVYLIFEKSVKMYFVLDSNEMRMMAEIDWLRILKAELRITDFKPHISIYINGRRIYSKFKNKAVKTDIQNLRALYLYDTQVKMYYGLMKPQFTGIFYAAVNFLTSLNNSIEIDQFPDYIPESEYFRIEAESNLNIGKSITNFFKQEFRTKRREQNWINQP